MAKLVYQRMLIFQTSWSNITISISTRKLKERERERETHRVAQPAGLTAGHYPTWSTIEPSDSQSTNVKDALFEGNGKSVGFPPTTWDRYGKLRICVSFPDSESMDFIHRVQCFGTIFLFKLQCWGIHYPSCLNDWHITTRYNVCACVFRLQVPLNDTVQHIQCSYIVFMDT